MKLLVLGGTEFVGRALVEEGLARGWEVTTFNRGSKAALPGVEAIVGDRHQGLDTLDLRAFDVVADTWSWEPSTVRDSARFIHTDRYVHISSRSVHAWPTPALSTEDAPFVDASMDDDLSEDYARTKRGAELAVLHASWLRGWSPGRICRCGFRRGRTTRPCTRPTRRARWRTGFASGH